MLLDLFDSRFKLRVATLEQRAASEINFHVGDDASALDQRGFGSLEIRHSILKQRAGRQFLHHRRQRRADGSLADHNCSTKLLHTGSEDFACGSAAAAFEYPGYPRSHAAESSRITAQVDDDARSIAHSTNCRADSPHQRNDEYVEANVADPAVQSFRFKLGVLRREIAQPR